MDEAISGCDVLVHMASPFIVGAPKTQDDLVKPAVQGTLNALRAAHKHGIKKVVLTSSCAAIYPGHNPPIPN